MGIWTDQVLPRVFNVCMNGKPLREVRARVCADLSGDVIEIGAGSGLNAPYYPSTVTGVWTVEPSNVSRKLAAKRNSETQAPVYFAGLDAQQLELPDQRFDMVLSTWTLCTIPDLDKALSEMLRVLKPGGAFHFVEHGLSPDDKVRHFQERWEPLHSRIAGGCKVTRRFPEQIEAAGFTVKDAEHSYLKAGPKYGSYICVGSAIKA
jgi:ubiquinone/menaquinone biosynthesis C-methylase UbiE